MIESTNARFTRFQRRTAHQLWEDRKRSRQWETLGCPLVGLFRVPTTSRISNYKFVSGTQNSLYGESDQVLFLTQKQNLAPQLELPCSLTHCMLETLGMLPCVNLLNTIVEDSELPIQRISHAKVQIVLG